MSVPPGHTALPALLPPSQPAPAGFFRLPIQPHPLPIPHTHPAGGSGQPLPVSGPSIKTVSGKGHTSPLPFYGICLLSRCTKVLLLRCKNFPADLCHHPSRSAILHESKMLLKCQAMSDQAVAEALCSIMLLEESSPRQALTDFLLARKAAIQKLLNQPHHGGYGNGEGSVFCF